MHYIMKVGKYILKGVGMRYKQLQLFLKPFLLIFSFVTILIQYNILTIQFSNIIRKS